MNCLKSISTKLAGFRDSWLTLLAQSRNTCFQWRGLMAAEESTLIRGRHDTISVTDCSNLWRISQSSVNSGNDWIYAESYVVHHSDDLDWLSRLHGCITMLRATIIAKNILIKEEILAINLPLFSLTHFPLQCYVSSNILRFKGKYR